MSLDGDTEVDYYERRAAEYDATSWDHPDAVPVAAERVRLILGAMPPADTVEIGCGTGYVSRWLPGRLTLTDASSAMLAVARRRLPRAGLVRSRVPPMPFLNGAFERAFCANVYGHLRAEERSKLVSEALRVANELVVLDQLAESGVFTEGPEVRRLNDGSTFSIHKCYFTARRMVEELGGGEVLMDGPVFAIVRRRR